MDKLSAVMISAICMLSCISIAVVYHTWFSGKDEAVYASSLAQIEEEMSLTNIAMNDDAQVINGGGQDMWIRAKIEVPETKQNTGDLKNRQEAYKLVSDTIVEAPTKAEMAKGVWSYEEDGYYYYSLPVSPGEQSKSLFTSVIGDTENGGLEGSSVKVQAEAVQVNWISKKAKNSEEAFKLFRLFQPLQEYKGKFV